MESDHENSQTRHSQTRSTRLSQFDRDAALQQTRQRWHWFLVAFAFVASASSVFGIETVTVSRDGEQQELSGRILVEAQDGGLLLETPEQIIWTIMPEEIVSRRSDDASFELADRKQLTALTLRDLPPGFNVHNTAHYVICYNTSKAYAQWCGALYERLHRAFLNFWKGHGIELTANGPLVAVVFRDKAGYSAYSQPELGEATNSIIGYYSLKSNRIVSYDLTGLEQLRAPGDRTGTMAHISQMLRRPQAERTVATIIHEATHQIAFNSGLQRRFADNPLWLSEGLAIYFESPDLKSRKGWRRIGAVNQFRLRQMRSYLQKRPAGSLTSLIVDDQRFRDSRLAHHAYAESWSLCYHLIRTRPQEFKAYLEKIGQKPPLEPTDPEARLAEFKAAFGDDIGLLDKEFVKAIQQWR